jgi:hypothetical protein
MTDCPASPRPPRPRWPVAIALASALVAATSAARADAPRACTDAVERGQSLRDAVKLRDARAAFLMCAEPPCPDVIQRQCAQWIAELDARIPSVIVTAGDEEGRDLVEVHVAVDGQPFADRLDGIAVPIDPGVHTFRFEAPGMKLLERNAVLREAERFQKLHVTLARAPAAPVPTTASPPALSAAAPARPESGRGTWGRAAIVATSVGVVAGGIFTYFAVAGAVDDHRLATSCSPNCAPASVDSLRGELRGADIALGVAVAALALATWFYFEWRAR